MIHKFTRPGLLPLLLLPWFASAHAETPVAENSVAEKYEACLTHPSAAYLEAFENELDKHDVSHTSIMNEGQKAVCVLPSDEEIVLKISRDLAKRKI